MKLTLTEPVLVGTYWLFPDGTTLPLVAGGDFEGEGGGAGGGGGSGGSGGSGEGGSGGSGGEGGSGEGGTGGEGGNEPLFPPYTPVAEMTSAQQVEYWKHQSRKHEGRARDRGDYDDLKKKAEQFDQQQAANATDQEKAVTEARTKAAEEARADERSKNAPLLVAAEMKAAAAGRITPERLEILLKPIDSTKFLTDTGEVDTDEVTAFITSVLPAEGNGAEGGSGKGKGNFPNLGQGKSSDGAKPTVSTGAERYRERHSKKST
jgi:hypothetical protein